MADSRRRDAGGLVGAPVRAGSAPDAAAGAQVLPLDLLPDARRDPARDRNRRARVHGRRGAHTPRPGAVSAPVARGRAGDSRARAAAHHLAAPEYNAPVHALVAELVDAQG